MRDLRTTATPTSRVQPIMRAIITGAARGIGQAIAHRLVQHNGGGATATCLVLADQHADELEALADVLRQQGARVETRTGDLADVDFPQRLADAAEAFGGLDAVASNAGLAIHRPLLRYSTDDWDRCFAVHARAPWLLAKACHAALKVSRGAFVITASISANHPTPPGGAYSPSKAATLMLARQLAVEWGPDGIRVNTVSPGMTLTPMTHAAYTAPGVMAQREARIPLRRIGQPEDVAAAVAFLMGPDAAYISGADLVVDGGLVNTLMAYNPGWAPAPT